MDTDPFHGCVKWRPCRRGQVDFIHAGADPYTITEEYITLNQHIDIDLHIPADGELKTQKKEE